MNSSPLHHNVKKWNQRNETQSWLVNRGEWEAQLCLPVRRPVARSPLNPALRFPERPAPSRWLAVRSSVLEREKIPWKLMCKSFCILRWSSSRQWCVPKPLASEWRVSLFQRLPGVSNEQSPAHAKQLDRRWRRRNHGNIAAHHMLTQPAPNKNRKERKTKPVSVTIYIYIYIWRHDTITKWLV